MPDMVSRFINYLEIGIIPDMVSRFIASDVNEIAFNDAIQKQLNFSPKQESEINQNINNLTNIINNNKINTNMKVYRGLTPMGKKSYLKTLKTIAGE